MGLSMRQIGMEGSNAIKNYCNNTFQIWSEQHLGDFVVDLDNTFVAVEKNYLCTKDCPCSNITLSKWSNYSNEAAFNISYQQKNFAGEQINSTLCLKNNDQFNKNIVGLLGELESKYNCSGMCQTPYFYSFFDVTKGPPQLPCHQELVSEFESMTGTFGRYSLRFYASGAILVLCWAISFGLCFWPKEMKVKITPPEEETTSTSPNARQR